MHNSSNVMPLTQQAATESALESRIPRFPEKRKGITRLLAVDDEKDYLSFIEVAAEDLGFEVFTLEDSTAFETVFSAFKPDILVVDIMMPWFDGIEIARYLAGSVEAKKVIFMSAQRAAYGEYAKTLADPHGIHSVHAISKPIHLGPFRDLLLHLSDNSAISKP